MTCGGRVEERERDASATYWLKAIGMRRAHMERAHKFYQLEILYRSRLKMGNLSVDQKKERFDDAYKVLLTIFTLMLSVVISFYGRTSSYWAIFLGGFYAFTICSWSYAHLTGGYAEYLIKFMSWFTLLGGITQAMIMLYLGTLDLHGYYYAANAFISLLLFYFVFNYAKVFMDKKDQKFFKIYFLICVAGLVVLTIVNFLYAI